MKYILLIIFICAETQIHAQDRWVYLTSTYDNNVNIYFDSETSQRNDNGSFTAWIKYENVKPKYESSLGKYVESYIERTLFSCGEKTYSTFSYIIYFSDGSSKSVTINYTEKSNQIFPDTVVETMYNYFCNY
jgi:hypothetical protein